MTHQENVPEVLLIMQYAQRMPFLTDFARLVCGKSDWVLMPRIGCAPPVFGQV